MCNFMTVSIASSNATAHNALFCTHQWHHVKFCDFTFDSEERPFADLNGISVVHVDADDSHSGTAASSLQTESVNSDFVDEDQLTAAEERKRLKRFAKILTLSVAYSANIGGTATLTGTPTNLLVAEVANK